MNSGPLYHLSFPTFPLLFFLGCNSTSRPAGGSLPSPDHSSARAGLNHCQLHQTSRGALVSLQSDSALKLPVVLLWRDYSTPTHTHTHTPGCVCSSAWLHLPSATLVQPRLLGDPTTSPWNVFSPFNQLYLWMWRHARMYQLHVRTCMESRPGQNRVNVHTCSCDTCVTFCHWMICTY